MVPRRGLAVSSTQAQPCGAPAWQHVQWQRRLHSLCHGRPPPTMQSVVGQLLHYCRGTMHALDDNHQLVHASASFGESLGLQNAPPPSLPLSLSCPPVTLSGTTALLVPIRHCHPLTTLLHSPPSVLPLPLPSFSLTPPVPHSHLPSSSSSSTTSLHCSPRDGLHQ